MWGRATLVMEASSTCMTVTIITENVMAHFRAAPMGASVTSPYSTHGGRAPRWSTLRDTSAKERAPMSPASHVRRLVPLALAALVILSSATARAQGDVRSPLPSPVKVKQGMTNVPALSPLWLLPEYAAKYNVQIDTVMFQRFADARTALASGDLDITAFGPQDITLAVAQGAQSLVGVAGVGSGNDCLVVRKGEDIRDWKDLGAKRIGIGAGSISWLKFAASVQEHGVDYGKLQITNIVGGGANYLKALQGRDIDVAVVWQPFCAQSIVDGYAQ